MSKTVLIVDDDADARSLMRLTLEADGFTAIEASDGADALAHISSSCPNLVVTDLEMPIMDGWELLEALERTKPLLPTLVITGREDPLVNRTRTPVLNKPLDQAKLIEQVRRSCKGSA
jgi:two-component system chemotaxis response regulator CheY